MKHVFIVEYVGDDIRRTRRKAGWTLHFAQYIFILCVLRFVVYSYFVMAELRKTIV